MNTTEPILDYRRTGDPLPLLPVRETMVFWSAVACWFVPLVAGILIVSAMALVRTHGSPRPVPGELNTGIAILYALGFADLFFGLLLTITGWMVALVLLTTRWPLARNKWREAALPGIGLIVLLASNIPVAILLVMIA